VHFSNPAGVGDGTIVGVEYPGFVQGRLLLDVLIHGIDAEVTTG
jgi:hypothetical protein